MDNHDYITTPTGGRRTSNRSYGEGTLLIRILLSTLFCFTTLILPGCSPKIIERVVYQRDTTTVHHRDSIYFRDSVYVKEWLKGDTVYIEKFKDRYIYKDRWRDSITVRVDSVAVESIKEVKVEKPLSWWKKFRIGAFWWLLAGLAASLVWIFRKPILAFLKTII